MQQNISTREREILILASKGHTDKAIAGELGISVRTVGTYWERLREKTKASGRTHLVMEVLGKELEDAARVANEAVAAWNRLVDQANDLAVFSMDLNGKILDWNTGVLRVLGYERAEFEGQHFSLVFTPEDLEIKQPELEMDQAREHGRFLERRYHQKKDGTHIWINGVLVAIYNELGEVKSFSKIMRDESERKSMEEEIQRLQVKTGIASKS